MHLYPARLQALDEGLGVIALVRPERRAKRQALAHARRRLAFGRSGRQRRLGRRHEPVAVLHQDVAKIGQTALLSAPLRKGAHPCPSSRRGRVRPLRLAKVDFAIAPRSWLIARALSRPSSGRPSDRSSSLTPRLSTSFHRPKNARRSEAPSPPSSEDETETLARSLGEQTVAVLLEGLSVENLFVDQARRTSETACRTPTVRPIAAPSRANREAATAQRAAISPAQSSDALSPRKALKTWRAPSAAFVSLRIALSYIASIRTRVTNNPPLFLSSPLILLPPISPHLPKIILNQHYTSPLFLNRL